MIAGAVAALAAVCVLQAGLGYLLSLKFLRELKDSHAAALQASGEGDARRALIKSDVEDKAREALKMQAELMDSGGVFPDPAEARAKKPVGI